MATGNLEGPRRPPLKTWSAFGNLGRRPSEYEIVTHNMNHTLRDTPLELGPDRHGNLWLMRHRDGIRLTVPDWNAFRDPDQLTYRKYVKGQDDSETYIDGIIQEFDRIGHAERAPDFLQTCLTPSRYLAHGLQMMSAYLQQLAPSTYVGNCAAFQTGDHLRRVQRVAYRTKQLDLAYPDRSFGKTERAAWEQLPDWQGLRKGIERLLVSFDWDDAFVGLNLVVKPLADEITLRQFAVVARRLGTDLDALVADNLFLDAERSRRWTAALTRFAIAGNPANREHLLGLVAKWRPLADEIVETGSCLLERFQPDWNRAPTDLSSSWPGVSGPAIPARAAIGDPDTPGHDGKGRPHVSSQPESAPGTFPAGSSSAGQIAVAVTSAWRDFLEGAGLQIE